VQFFSKSIMAKQKLRAQQHSTTAGTDGALSSHDQSRDNDNNIV
jgi:hypothetical protein